MKNISKTISSHLKINHKRWHDTNIIQYYRPNRIIFKFNRIAKHEDISVISFSVEFPVWIAHINFNLRVEFHNSQREKSGFSN